MEEDKVIGKLALKLHQKNISNKYQTQLLKTYKSAWTPRVHGPSKQQLFNERHDLIINWFDFWTDSQRKRLLQSLLQMCSKDQLYFVQTWFVDRVPFKHIDFSRLLTRQLCLRIFSYLDPKCLCRAAQVSWHWKFLTEDDVLWRPKCQVQGWYLPYTPADNEIAAWKRHYVACLAWLDFEILPFDPESTDAKKAEKSQLMSLQRKRNRWIWRNLSAEARKEILDERPPWLPNSWKPRDMTISNLAHESGVNPNDPDVPAAHLLYHNRFGILRTLLKTAEPGSFRSRALLSFEDVDAKMTTLCNEHKELTKRIDLQNLEEARLSEMIREKADFLPNVDTNAERPALSGGAPHVLPWRITSHFRGLSQDHIQNPRVIFISSKIPAVELLLNAVLADVICISYEYESTTLKGLLNQLNHVLQGRVAKSIGIFAHAEKPGEVRLLLGEVLVAETLKSPNMAAFFTKLATHINRSTDGGHIDVFLPLAASESGLELLLKLSTLCAMRFSSPSGIACSLHDMRVPCAVSSEWLIQPEGRHPPEHYFCPAKLLVWSTMADQMAEACSKTRDVIGRFFEKKKLDAIGKIVGQVLFDATCQQQLRGVNEIADILLDALVNLGQAQTNEVHSINALEYIGRFLLSKSGISSKDELASSLTSSLPMDTGRRQLSATQQLLASRGSGNNADANKDDWNNNNTDPLEDDANGNNGNRLLSEEILTEEEEVAEEMEGECAAPSSKKDSTRSRESGASKGNAGKLSLSLSLSNGADDEGREAANWQPASARNASEPRKQWQPMTAREPSKTVRASSAYRMTSLLETNSNTLCQMASLVGHGGLYTTKANDKISVLELDIRADRRTLVALEIFRSETAYMRTLKIVYDTFYRPLESALSYNRAVLSAPNVELIFTDLLALLALSRSLLHDLKKKFLSWSPAQCLGDVFVKYSEKFNTFVNFLKNYPTILITIERCTELYPTFRAFLNRHERTPQTKMLTLPELFLTPIYRVEEYITLLTWFESHTPPDHADRNDIQTAIHTISDLSNLIKECRTRSQTEDQLAVIQKQIIGCPQLLELNRQFITHIDVASLQPSSTTVEPSLRIYHHNGMLGLFLFTDALIVAKRTTRNHPFERFFDYNYRFVACSSLVRLQVEDIPDSKYVKNAFAMNTLTRYWTCSTETASDKYEWITLLQQTVKAAIKD